MANSNQTPDNRHLITRKEMIVDSFKARLKDWYINAKDSYGIEGSGECKFLDPRTDEASNSEMYDFVLAYNENGQEFVALYSGYAQDLLDNEIVWLFNIWSEALFVTKKAGENRILTQEEILDLYSV